MPRRNSRFTQTILGLVLGVMMTQTAKAQFAVTVVNDTSPSTIKQMLESVKQTVVQGKSYATGESTRLEQIAEHAKTAKRWITTAEHYTRQINEDVRRFTSLKGILSVGEERLGLDDDTMKAMADLGQTMRACLALKQQFETLVHTRLRMVESMYTRARTGVFNPAQDMQDLDDYLRDGIGRSSEQIIATRERLAQMDNELETWTYDYKQLQKERAYKQTQLNSVIESLKKESALSTDIRPHTVSETGDRTGPRLLRRENQSAETTSTLLTTKTLLEGQISDLDKRIADLRDKINERFKRYHSKFDEAKTQASGIRQSLEGWDAMDEAKANMIRQMIDPYNAPANDGSGAGSK